MNDLDQMMRADVASAPHYPDDLDRVLDAGRRRVRRRSRLAMGGTVLAVAAVVAAGVALTVPTTGTVVPSSDAIPIPEGPRLSLDGAEPAVEGTHYRALATRTNKDLEEANGIQLRGLTDDGLTLLQDNRRGDSTLRLGLRPPEGGRTTWLTPGGSELGIPLALGTDELVLLAGLGESDVWIETYDRRTGSWSRNELAALAGATLGGEWEEGPDGRVYVSVELDQPSPPEGGWPIGEDGKPDDTGAGGPAYRVFSFDPAEPGAVRDENLTVSSFDLGARTLVWTEETKGDAAKVHVRDLDTGQERSFDPRTGDRCTLDGISAGGDLVALNQKCGTYGSVDDDRLQILSTDGDLVGTFQSPGIGGSFVRGVDNLLQLRVRAHTDDDGLYLHDLKKDTSWRAARGFSTHSLHPVFTRPGEVTWDAPVNGGRGEVTTIARWLD